MTEAEKLLDALARDRTYWVSYIPKLGLLAFRVMVTDGSVERDLGGCRTYAEAHDSARRMAERPGGLFINWYQPAGP